MAVVAFVRPSCPLADAPAVPGQSAAVGRAEKMLRRYGRAMQCGFVAILAAWVVLEAGCVLSLFLHFRSGIVVGTIDGTIAFRFWPAIDYFSPDHALATHFARRFFEFPVACAYAGVLAVASVPFCASLWFLAELFRRYAVGEVFSPRNARVMRRIGHAIMATGYSPLLLGPVAHAIGVLKPVTGVTDAMIAFTVLGLILLAMSHVIEIGQAIQQDQELIL